MLAKSKLISKESLMPQSLIDLDISHEEFKTFVNEKEKYDQMKESIRNKKMKMNLVKIHKLTKKYFFILFCVIYKNGCYYCSSLCRSNSSHNKSIKLFWVKMIDVQKGLRLKNMPDLVRKEICGIFETKNPTEEQKKKYIRTESEITKKPADDSKYKYARSDQMEKNN